MPCKQSSNADRRRFLSAAAMTIAGARLSAVAAGPVQSSGTRTFGDMRQIAAGVLNVGYAETGPAGGPPVILLYGHG
jgi:hypothetical protein